MEQRSDALARGDTPLKVGCPEDGTGKRRSRNDAHAKAIKAGGRAHAYPSVEFPCHWPCMDAIKQDIAFRTKFEPSLGQGGAASSAKADQTRPEWNAACIHSLEDHGQPLYAGGLRPRQLTPHKPRQAASCAVVNSDKC